MKFTRYLCTTATMMYIYFGEIESVNKIPICLATYKTTIKFQYAFLHLNVVTFCVAQCHTVGITIMCSVNDRHMAVVQTHTVRVYLHYTRIMDYKSSNTSRNLNKNPFSRCLVFLSAAVPFDGRHRPELAGPSGWRGQPALRS